MHAYTNFKPPTIRGNVLESYMWDKKIKINHKAQCLNSLPVGVNISSHLSPNMLESSTCNLNTNLHMYRTILYMGKIWRGENLATIQIKGIGEKNWRKKLANVLSCYCDSSVIRCVWKYWWGKFWQICQNFPTYGIH